MFRYLLVFWLLLFPSGSLFSQLAQLHIIGKPILSKSELIGKRDVNGRFCAGVEVISDMDGFKYTAYNGVVKVDDKPGKDLVYLQPDERVLTIYHTGYEPLKIILSEIGIHLKPHAVWIIKVEGLKKQGAENVSNMAFLMINSQPNGAKVFINGEKVGITFLQKVLPAGKYHLRLEYPNYHPLETDVDVPNTGKKELNYRLKPNFGSIDVTTNPPGARLFLDGKLMGASPIKLNIVRSGRHTLRAEKDFYHAVEKSVEIKDEQKRTLNLALAPAFAKLMISTRPDSARFLLDGIEKGLSPYVIDHLSSGTYQISLRKPWYVPYDTTVTVTEGHNVNLNIKLRPDFGYVNVSTNPPNATILIDGKNRGSAPQTSKLRCGDHVLEVKNERYVSIRRHITVKSNRTDHVIVNLPKRTGRLILSCLPVGAHDAEVYIDRRKVGQAPIILNDLLIGSHILDLRKDGYYYKPRKIEIKEGKTLQLTETLSAKKLVNLDANVPGARISVDGELKGELPLSLSLPLGDVSFAVRKEGYKTLKVRRKINSNTDQLYFTLKRQTGILTITSNVKRARLSVDGKLMAKKLPARLELEAGNYHMIELDSKRYITKSENIYVEANQSKKHSIPLEMTPELKARKRRWTLNGWNILYTRYNFNNPFFKSFFDYIQGLQMNLPSGINNYLFIDKGLEYFRAEKFTFYYRKNHKMIAIDHMDGILASLHLSVSIPLGKSFRLYGGGGGQTGWMLLTKNQDFSNDYAAIDLSAVVATAGMDWRISKGLILRWSWERTYLNKYITYDSYAAGIYFAVPKK